MNPRGPCYDKPSPPKDVKVDTSAKKSKKEPKVGPVAPPGASKGVGKKLHIRYQAGMEGF